MPTILDQLTLELGWDIRKFLESGKEVEQVVRQRREDFERQSKVWDAALGGLVRLLGSVAAAFLSIETAIKGLEASRTIAQTGTEFANLADVAGMSVEQLALWEQALARVGGSARDAGEAFKFQQSELQKTRITSGAPSWLGYAQRLGLPDWKTYFNERTGQYDLDRFNKDIADAMARQNLSAAQRAEYLKAFGWNGVAAQRLFTQDLRRRLEETRPTAPTQANIETFRRLNEAWTKLGQTAEAVSRDLVTYLEKPIEKVLEMLRKGAAAIDDWIKSLAPGGLQWDPSRPVAPGWNPFSSAPAPAAPVPGASSPGTPAPPSSGWPSWFDPGRPMAPGWNPFTSAPGTSSAVPAPAPHPGNVYIDPRTGNGGMAPDNEAPGTFDERFAPAPPPNAGNGGDLLRNWMRGVPHSSLEAPSNFTALTNLPRSANAAAASPAGTTTTTTNSSVTIGGMSFHSRADDTAMGKAPSSIAKDLSVGSYAVHANESLE